MPKSFRTIFFVTLAVIITLGLAISLQSVFGLNIAGTLAGPLNLGGNRITNLGVPLPGNSSDAATKGYVDSAAGGPVSTGLYGICNWCPSCPVNRCGGFVPPFTSCTDAGGCVCSIGVAVQTGSWQAFNTVNIYSCYKVPPYATPYPYPSPYSTP